MQTFPDTKPDNDYVPPAVVERVFADQAVSPMRAWRKHLGCTQAEIAARLGISQSAYAQQENRPRTRVRKSTLAKFSAALGIHPDQLDF